MADKRNVSLDLLQMHERNTTYLDELQQNLNDEMLPFVVGFGVLGLLGAIGNILTIVFFLRCKHSTTVTLILCHSCADFLVCIMIIPKIFQLSILITNRYAVLCQLTHFFAYAAITCSCLLLIAIAVDRYMKICRAFKTHLTLKATKYLITGIVVFSFAVSTKHFFVADCVPVTLTFPNRGKTTTGFYCTRTLHDKSTSTVFDVVDSVFILISWAVLVTCYTKMIRKICNLKKTRELSKVQLSSKEKFRQKKDKAKIRTIDIDNGSLSDNSTPVEAVCCHDNNEGENIPLACISFNKKNTLNKWENNSHLCKMQIRETNVDSNSLSTVGTMEKTIWMTTLQRRNKNRKPSVSGGQMTFMLLVVSILYIMCFTPYLAVKVVIRDVYGNSPEFEIKSWVQAAFFLVYLNSVVNPAIYMMFNVDFQKFLRCK